MENTSLEMLSLVAKGLKNLKRDVAFVGGAAVALHVTDQAAPPVRPTEDVDCVVEIASGPQYREMERELMALGFKHSLTEPGPICRWIFLGLKVDIMPTEGKVLGFHNQWYKEGLKASKAFILPDGMSIQAFTLPYLLATKIEAFLGRGHDDFRGSHDMEDIFALVDGAPKAKEEVFAGPVSVGKYISEKFATFLANQIFLESAEGNLLDAGRAARALGIIRALSQYPFV